MKGLFYSAAAIAVLASAGVAHAQTGVPTVDPTQVIQRIPAEAFAQFRPQNAQEMVNRIEGFTFNVGDPGSRELSGAGNTLIDGVRVKLDGRILTQELSAIPFNSVVEIQILRAGSGFDMQQYDMLANVIVRRVGIVSGSANSTLTIIPNGHQGIEGTVDLQRRLGDQTISAGFDVGALPTSGTGVIETSRTCLLTVISRCNFAQASDQLQRQSASGFNRNYAARLGYEDVIFGGRFRANINATDSESGSRNRTVDRLNGGAVSYTDPSSSSSKGLNYNARYTRTFATLIGPVEFDGNASHVGTKSTNVSTNTVANRVRTTETDRGTESGSFYVRYRGIPKWTLQSGVESELVWADTSSVNTVNGAVVGVPSDRSDADRLRMQVYTSAIWEFSPKITMELGARFDSTTITTKGANPLETKIPIWRPRLSVTYRFRPQTTASLTVDRQVGNIDVNLFGSSIRRDGDVDVIVAGNPNIVPETNWTAVARFDHRWNRTGQFSVTYTHVELIDILDNTVVIGSNGALTETTDNVGDGTRDTVNVTLNSPLDRFGLPNATVRMTMDWKKSELTDPFTGARRRDSGEQPFSWSLNYTQEFFDNALRTGFTAQAGQDSITFRRGDISYGTSGTLYTAFMEYRATPSVTLRFDIRNITSRTFYTDRIIYARAGNQGTPTDTSDDIALPGYRVGGLIAGTERRISKNGPTMEFNIRKSF